MREGNLASFVAGSCECSRLSLFPSNGNADRADTLMGLTPDVNAAIRGVAVASPLWKRSQLVLGLRQVCYSIVNDSVCFRDRHVIVSINRIILLLHC